MHGIFIYRHAVYEKYQKTSSTRSKMEGKLYRILSIITFSLLYFASRLRGQSENDTWNNIDRPGGRYYSFSTCAYGLEPGYTCLSCSRALHCYPSNFAILVDCPLIFPYCRNGRCSRVEGPKCFEEQKVSTPADANVLTDENAPSHDETILSISPISSIEDKVTTKDGLISPVQETMSKTSSTEV